MPKELINFTVNTLMESKQLLVQGMDLVNIPTTLNLLATILREDVQATIEDKEANPEYCENLLKLADDLEHVSRRRFK